MTVQRRRGLPIVIYPYRTLTDRRGNEKRVLDASTPRREKAWIYPQRSAKAEVPGQQQINVVRVGLTADVSEIEDPTGLDLHAQVDFLGKRWDVVTPPAYHHGTRHTRHWSLDLRERPNRSG